MERYVDISRLKREKFGCKLEMLLSFKQSQFRDFFSSYKLHFTFFFSFGYLHSYIFVDIANEYICHTLIMIKCQS